MKKFFVLLLMACCFTFTVADAAELPQFLNGNKNYPLIWKDSQAAWYLDKSSIKIKVNDTPFFIITAQILTANGNETYEYFFDEEEADMRIFDRAVSDWQYISPSDGVSKKYLMYIGEAVFYVSQGRKFYGNYLWKKEIDDKIIYTDEFADEIYNGWT